MRSIVPKKKAGAMERERSRLPPPGGGRACQRGCPPLPGAELQELHQERIRGRRRRERLVGTERARYPRQAIVADAQSTAALRLETAHRRRCAGATTAPAASPRRSPPAASKSRRGLSADLTAQNWPVRPASRSAPMVIRIRLGETFKFHLHRMVRAWRLPRWVRARPCDRGLERSLNRPRAWRDGGGVRRCCGWG